ncbi:FAD-dependent monooxygenase [Nocardia asiatica]|uniref:FAD-dependent monooxygenase n=1 Tax=Nocardia asiatica TaxID=209252 RepID=UPI003EE27ABB
MLWGGADSWLAASQADRLAARIPDATATVTVTGTTQEPDSVAATLSKGGPLHARYLPAADGTHSVARERSGIGFTCGTTPNRSPSPTSASAAEYPPTRSSCSSHRPGWWWSRRCPSTDFGSWRPWTRHRTTRISRSCRDCSTNAARSPTRSWSRKWCGVPFPRPPPEARLLRRARYSVGADCCRVRRIATPNESGGAHRPGLRRIE